MTKSSVNTHVFYVSGCDQCTEPDCVPYKTLCCVVELTYCSFFHQFGVSFLDSCFLDRKTRALFSLRLHSSHVLRQFFGTRTKPAPEPPQTGHRIFYRHINNSSPSCSTDHTNETSHTQNPAPAKPLLSSHQRLITVVFY